VVVVVDAGEDTTGATLVVVPGDGTTRCATEVDEHAASAITIDAHAHRCSTSKW
jgi:hypothetical protein